MSRHLVSKPIMSIMWTTRWEFWFMLQWQTCALILTWSWANLYLNGDVKILQLLNLLEINTIKSFQRKLVHISVTASVRLQLSVTFDCWSSGAVQNFNKSFSINSFRLYSTSDEYSQWLLHWLWVHGIILNRNRIRFLKHNCSEVAWSFITFLMSFGISGSLLTSLHVIKLVKRPYPGHTCKSYTGVYGCVKTS